MTAGRISLVGGGTRSGKSRFALALARDRGARRAFIATATVTDPDMGERIARHRAERPDFTTIEAPMDLAGAIGTVRDVDVLVVDCLTLFVSNHMFAGEDTDAIVEKTEAALRVMHDAPFETILVTNEVGMSLHAPTELGRRFVDTAGRVHQTASGAADEVYLAAIGTVLRLRPAPVGEPDLVLRRRRTP